MARSFPGNNGIFGPDGMSVHTGLASGYFGAFVKTTQVVVGNPALLLNGWDGSSSEGFGLFQDVNGKADVQGHDWLGAARMDSGPSTTSINSGAWIHIGVNWNIAGGGTNHLAISGLVEKTVASSSAWSFNGASTWELGGWYASFWQDPICSMAEACLYNRQLTADEMLMLGGVPAFAPPLVAPASLLRYQPLVTNIHDTIRSGTATDSGSTETDHPRVLGSFI